MIRRQLGNRLDPALVNRKLRSILEERDCEAKVTSILEFANLELPSQVEFIELYHAMHEWEILDQIDELTPDQRQKVEPFLSYAWKDNDWGGDKDYPEGFHVRTPQKQLDCWLQLIPSLNSRWVEKLTSAPLPTEAEGWAVMPKPVMLAKADYYKALTKIFDFFPAQYKFQNCLVQELTSEHLWLTRRTATVHQELDRLPGDFWVFPFQFGRRWAEKSVRHSRILYIGSEFGLSLYESIALLVTHPERITGPDQLYFSCPGCVCDNNGLFNQCPYLYWSQRSGGLRLLKNFLGSGSHGHGHRLPPGVEESVEFRMVQGFKQHWTIIPRFGGLSGFQIQHPWINVIA